MPTPAELEALFVNNPEFSQIQAHLGRFNPIRIMQASQSEIRNSAILSWLLDPHESHGLNDDFLRAFLSGALRNKGSLISSLDVISADLFDVEVRTEENPDYGKRCRIDILIDCPTAKWIFVIENKLSSTQSENQLKKYYDGLKTRLKREGRSDTKIQGIYLTLNAEEPEDESKDSFVPYAHDEYAEQLAFLVEQKRDALSNKIVDFLEYFIEVVMENSEANHPEEQRIREIAKGLYRQHRRVIDYIVENGSQTVLTEAFTTLIIDYPERKEFEIDGVRFILMRSGKRWLSFNPVKWQSLFDSAATDLKVDNLTWGGCENWRLPVPVGFWVQMRETNGVHKLKVAIEVGPLKHYPQRILLIEKIEAHIAAHNKRAEFRKSAKEPSAKYSIFKSKDKKTSPDDVDQVSEMLKGTIGDLIDYVEPVNNAISEWIDEISSHQHPKNLEGSLDVK